MLSGLIAYPITPTDAAGRVQVDTYARLIARLIDAGVDGICAMGSTGIYPFLDLSERKRAMQAAAEAVQGRVPLIAGLGALRSDHAIELAQEAARLGLGGGLLAPVSYQPLTEAEVLSLYTDVAEAGLPLCIYNNPGTTRFTFGPQLLAQIAALPQVRAVKMPLAEDLPGEIAALRADLPDGFGIGYSADWGCGPALLAGADAFHSGIAGIVPTPMLALARAAQAGDTARVDQINTQLAPLWDLCRAHGGMRSSYALAGLLGLSNALPPRPVLPVPDMALATRALEAAQSVS